MHGSRFIREYPIPIRACLPHVKFRKIRLTNSTGFCQRVGVFVYLFPRIKKKRADDALRCVCEDERILTTQYLLGSGINKPDVQIMLLPNSCKHANLHAEYTQAMTQMSVRKLADANAFHVHRIRYDTRCYFNVRSKADISQLNLPHGTDN